jgi:1-pyrroline-5-carboxylate dehydrogenase
MANFRITYSVLNADLSELHKEFDVALNKVKSSLGKEHPAFVGGKEYKSSQFLDNHNPANLSELLGRFCMVDKKDIDSVFEHADKAQKKWARVSWQEKVAFFKKAAGIISERKLEIAAIMALETGKNRIEALGEVEESADLFRYIAGQLEDAQGFERPMGALAPNEKTKTILRPYGIFVVVSPFNFPMALACGMSSGAMLGGKAVILNPSQ